MFIGKVQLHDYPDEIWFMSDPPSNLTSLDKRNEAKLFRSKSAVRRFFHTGWNHSAPAPWNLIEIIELGPRGGVVRSKAKRKSAKKRA